MDPAAFSQTRDELALIFGAVSFLPGSTLGIWHHQGQRYEDESLKIVIDVEDTAESRRFFSEYKAVLRDRFEQIEIYIVSYLIDVI